MKYDFVLLLIGVWMMVCRYVAVNSGLCTSEQAVPSVRMVYDIAITGNLPHGVRIVTEQLEQIEVSGQLHALVALLLRKSPRYPLGGCRACLNVLQ
jgi:hypothetical protein